MAFIKISETKFIELNFFKFWEKDSNTLTIYKSNFVVENLFNKTGKFGLHLEWVLFGLTLIDLRVFDNQIEDIRELDPIVVESDAVHNKEDVTTDVVEWYIVELQNRNGYTELNANEDRVIYWSFPSLSNPLWTKAFLEYKDTKGKKTIREL
jgi:hypothetical protein